MQVVAGGSGQYELSHGDSDTNISTLFIGDSGTTGNQIATHGYLDTLGVGDDYSVQSIMNYWDNGLFHMAVINAKTDGPYYEYNSTSVISYDDIPDIDDGENVYDAYHGNLIGKFYKDSTFLIINITNNFQNIYAFIINMW